MKLLKEFRDFAMKGNVIDMAVGVIIGASFGKIVSSLVNDIIMPLVGRLVGKVNFSNLFFNLSGTPYLTLDEAKKAGASTVNYGLFLNMVLDFVIVAFVIFVVVGQLNRLKRQPQLAPPGPPTTKDCPLCLMTIPINAKRCGHCTSNL